MAKTKQQLLDEIQAKILEENICRELAEQATQLVFGTGSADADIVFIGEAPGKKEDLKGEPFVGAAGKFLNEMLAMIGLERQDIYITNIVKYRPPNNRDPLPEEKDAFLPFLNQQIDVIEPKLIITLGRHSMDAILPGLKISQVHGQPKRIPRNALGRAGDPGVSAMQGGKGVTFEDSGKASISKSQLTSLGEQRTKPYEQYGEGAAEPTTQQRATSWVILPLFHPAAALYDGSLRQTLIDDFAKIPLILEKIK